MEIRYITLYVDSIASDIDFYTGKLGFRLVKRTKFLDQNECATLIKENGSVALMIIQNEPDTRQGTTVVLNSADFLKDHFELKGQGVSFLEEPEYTSSGIAASFKDLSGNRWVLIEERDYSIN